MKHFIGMVTVGAVVLGAFSATTVATAAAGDLGAKFKVGDTAPDFTLEDLEGRQVRLSDVARKKVVLLVFWSLRCEACLREVPALEKIHKAFAGRGVALLSVLTDGLDAATSLAMMKAVGISPGYPVLTDPDYAVSEVYTTFVVPHVLVIDRKGAVRYLHTGFETGDEKAYAAALEGALRP